MHAAEMADELSEREQALRRLPLSYSLALRLRDAGVAADVICPYVNVEQAAPRTTLGHCRLGWASGSSRPRLSSTAPRPAEIAVALYCSPLTACD
jgi:hypothetical protein